MKIKRLHNHVMSGTLYDSTQHSPTEIQNCAVLSQKLKAHLYSGPLSIMGDDTFLPLFRCGRTGESIFFISFFPS
jgi:hypothetical protein